MHRLKFLRKKMMKKWTSWHLLDTDELFLNAEFEDEVLNVAKDLESYGSFYYDENWSVLYFENERDFLMFKLAMPSHETLQP